MKRIIINGVDFYHQFHAVLEDYDIASPEPKIVKVSVPGRNGDLDMSEALTGTIAYNNRQITVRLGLVGRLEERLEKEQKILQLIAGNRVRLTFSHLEGYFKGRCWVKEIQLDNDSHTTIVLTIDCEPYRYELEKHEISLELSGKDEEVQCKNLQMPTQPIIITTNKTTIQFQKQSITVQAGDHLLPFLFTSGENIIKISGSGMVTIQYQRGVL